MTISILVHNALMLPMAGDEPVVRDAWLLAEDGIIAATGSRTPPAVDADTEVVDAGGAFLAPGFVSSHSHLFTSGSRGLGVDQTLYGWCSAMFGVTGLASPEDIYWCTLHGSLDMINNGVTTAFDFTDGRLPWEPMIEGKRTGGGELRPLEYLLKQVDGKLDSGIRFVNSVMIDDTIGTREEVLERLAQVIDYCDMKDPSRLLGKAISGALQWSPNPDCASIEVEAMGRFGIINQAHFLETREETELQRSKFDLYDEAGGLGPDLIFGHFVQTTPEIIQRAAAAGAGMSWQPSSNGRLASGIADVPAMRDSGMRIGMGLDDQSCTDISDPWQNLRMGMYLTRAVSGDPTSLTPLEVLRMHTLGSAEILKIDAKVGSLEPGKFADFVIVDPRAPDIGPLWDPVASYVLACGLRNLKAVYIGGELKSAAGVLVDSIAAEASARIHDILPKIRQY